MGKTPSSKGRRKKAKRRSVPGEQSGRLQVVPNEAVFTQVGLLESFRTRWQHAEWAALMQVGLDDIRDDPDRGKLAALIASVHSAFGDPGKATEFFSAALDWNCDREIAARLMMSAAQNTLARANTTIGDLAGAEKAFSEAIALVEPRSDVNLLAQLRQIRENVNMGMRRNAMRLVDEQILSIQTQTQARYPPLAYPARNSAEPRQDVSRERGYISNAETNLASVASPFSKTVVVGTQPRTGSTWVYNAVRFLLEELDIAVYGSWCEHYRGRREGDTRAHIVKVHEKNQLAFPYDFLITTHRDLADRLGSAIRMGWVKKTEEAVINARNWAIRMDEFWSARSDVAIDFGVIEGSPEKAIRQISRALGFPETDDLMQRVDSRIRALQQPSANQKYDPVSLLHPGHRSDGTETRELAAWIRSVFAKQDDVSNRD